MAQAQEAAKGSMITITLPDGATREYSAGTSGMDIAQSISKSLAKACVAIEIDGELSDLSLAITKNVSIALIKRDDDKSLELIRHDCAHVLAEAVQELFPGTQVTIGPNIEDGFFYDFAKDEPFTTEDLPKIEKKMRQIIERGDAFTREVWDRKEAIAYFKDKGEAYKAEIIEDLPADEDIKIYRQGEWLDLCRGPHMPTTKQVGAAFKLMKVAGAYWRGDSKNAMLSRIYGTAWRTKDELDAYLHRLEEAEKRDHRKLGREMDLFHLQEEAQGSVFWHPKGYTIWKQLESYIRRRQEQFGYEEVKTPQLIDNKLWEASGHWGKFRENMFVVPDEIPSTDDDQPILSGKGRLMALKPMNCPAHVQIFKQGTTSYRDLPIRMAEFGCCHRNEAHGALHGIMRVRQMTQDDAHVFCREDQIMDEVKSFIEMFFAVYKDFGFEDIKILLATRPEKRTGSDESWDLAEKSMADALDALGYEFEYAEGEGAFYGPKYEFHLRDAIGRSWQMGTCQLDFGTSERLDGYYIDEQGEKRAPVMIHRAVFGTFERFMGLLIESYAGKFPIWLAPVQAVVANITLSSEAYARDLVDRMKTMGIRVELDIRNEKINYKIREHSLKKVPYIFVVGAKEAEDNTVAIRQLGGKDQTIKSADDAINSLALEAKPPY